MGSSQFNMVSSLDFTQRGADKELSLSTLKVLIATLIVFLQRPLHEDALVSRFCKALSRKRPIKERKSPIWDLSLVCQSYELSQSLPLNLSRSFFEINAKICIFIGDYVSLQNKGNAGTIQEHFFDGPRRLSNSENGSRFSSKGLGSSHITRYCALLIL